MFLVGYFEKIGVEQPQSGDQRNPNSLKITYQTLKKIHEKYRHIMFESV